MASVNTTEASSRLEELVRKAENGEVTTITRDGQPVADLVPHKDENKKRKGGIDWEAGERFLHEHGVDRLVTWVSPDFDDPLPEDFLITPLPEDFDRPKPAPKE
jgi:prevent-host-death family protein